MNKILLLSLSLLVSWGAAIAQDNPLLGKWKTIDDETGRVKSVVEITAVSYTHLTLPTTPYV